MANTLVALVLLVSSAVFRSVCSKYPVPTFVEPVMQNVTAIKGEDVEFRCKIENIRKHMVAFIKADVPPRLIAFDERVFRQRDKYEIRPRVNSNEWVLKIRNVQEADIGAYSCQLNTDPAISRIGHLALRIPPSVSRTTPSAVEVREGHNVTLVCKAHGSPPPTVVWRRQDRQIIRFNGANGYGASVFNGSELRLTKVSRKHMSEYVCVASNNIPPDESWTVKLHVTFEPIVIPKAKAVEAIPGSLVRLVCNVDAWPRPAFSWMFNGKEIYNSGKYSLEHSVSEKYKTVHVLEIKDVGPSQYGIYRCMAKNDNGKHFADIQLSEAAPQRFNSVVLSEVEGSAESGISIDDEDNDADGVDQPLQRHIALQHPTHDDRPMNRRAQHHIPERAQHELRQDAENEPDCAASLVARISTLLAAAFFLLNL